MKHAQRATDCGFATAPLNIAHGEPISGMSAPSLIPSRTPLLRACRTVRRWMALVMVASLAFAAGESLMADIADAQAVGGLRTVAPGTSSDDAAGAVRATMEARAAYAQESGTDGSTAPERCDCPCHGPCPCAPLHAPAVPAVLVASADCTPRANRAACTRRDLAPPSPAREPALRPPIA